MPGGRVLRVPPPAARPPPGPVCLPTIMPTTTPTTAWASQRAIGSGEDTRAMGLEARTGHRQMYARGALPPRRSHSCAPHRYEPQHRPSRPPITKTAGTARADRDPDLVAPVCGRTNQQTCPLCGSRHSMVAATDPSTEPGCASLWPLRAAARLFPQGHRPEHCHARGALARRRRDQQSPPQDIPRLGSPDRPPQQRPARGGRLNRSPVCSAPQDRRRVAVHLR